MITRISIITLNLLLGLLIDLQMFGQLEKTDSLKKELIGTWDFFELRDKYNNKIDTIRFGKLFEIPQGPLTIYRADGTYSRHFTPENIDNGKWYFNAEENTIIHLLYYEKPYDFVSKDLIERGVARKDSNGEYYELVTQKVVMLTNERLTLSERGDTQRTFMRVN